MNQLVFQQAGGALVFKGTVSEPATVTVGGKPGTVTADNRFEGQAVVPGGTGQVAVTATDPSGNVRTSTYQVSQGATSKSFTYDLNGNMTSDGTRTYEWDAENRLVAVKDGGATVASYTYRNDGIRTGKTVGAVTASYVLEGASVVEERFGAGSVTKHFQGLGIDKVLGMQDGSGVVSYLTRDHLGSVREQTDRAGVIAVRRAYDPWGELSAGAVPGGWAFTGREWEAETGLYYHRARFYHPKAGRFVSEDPLRAGDGVSRYAFVRNNPLRFSDALGLRPGEPFDSREVAVLDTLRWLVGNTDPMLLLKYEWGGHVCESPNGKFCTTGPRTDNDPKRVDVDKVPCTAEKKNAGYYHTHPVGPTEFGTTDMWIAKNAGQPAYVWGPEDGQVLKYEWVYPGKPTPIGNVPLYAK
jgi:RHS repeat-associated protein